MMLLVIDGTGLKIQNIYQLRNFQKLFCFNSL